MKKNTLAAFLLLVRFGVFVTAMLALPAAAWAGIELVSRPSQPISVNSFAAEPFVVRVVDWQGRGVPDSPVSFWSLDRCTMLEAELRNPFSIYVVKSCTHGNFPPSGFVLTDADGIATSPLLSAGSIPGQITVIAQSGGSLEIPVSISGPAHLRAMESRVPVETAQRGEWNVQFTDGISDLSGLRVDFTVHSGGGAPGATLENAVAFTDANGWATARFTANVIPGEYTISARMGDETVNARVLNISVTTVGGLSISGTGEVSLHSEDFHFPRCSLYAFRSQSPRDEFWKRPENAPPAGIAFPHGIFRFSSRPCTFGDFRMTLRYPPGLPQGAKLWAFGLTRDNPINHWRIVPAQVGDGSMSFTLNVNEVDIDPGDISYDGVLALGLGDSGAPAYQDLWWAGAGDGGWGMSVLQRGDALFAVVHGHGADGKPTWSVMPGGKWKSGRDEFSAALYSPRATPWSSYDSSKLAVGSPVGSATLRFGDGLTAELDYSIGAASGRKVLTRRIFGPFDDAALPDRGGMWWGGPSQSGWGLAVLQQYSTLYSLWFTYDESGAPTWFAMPSGSWTAKDVYEGRVYRSTGPSWLSQPYDASKVQDRDVGSFRLRFDEEKATFEYFIEGRSGTLPLTRQPF